MSEQLTKIFVTKYALTQGIFECDAEVGGDYAYFKRVQDFCSTQCCKGEWFLTRKEAVQNSETMRLKKIASLKKQIAKMENLKFE